MTEVAVTGAGDTLGEMCLTGCIFPGYPKAPADSYINRMKRYAHDRGITISGTGVKNDFATADKAVRAEGVDLTKVWIKVAELMGLRTRESGCHFSVRIDALRFPSGDLRSSVSLRSALRSKLNANALTARG